MAGEIFISYRRADQAWARLLHAQLQAEGVEAWYDAHVGAGEDWRVATAQALESSEIFVLLFSSNAAASSDIAKELAAAVLEKKLIVPVRLENIPPKGAFLYELASRNWINAYEDTEARLAELAKSLARLVRTGGSVPAGDGGNGGPNPAPATSHRSLPMAAGSAKQARAGERRLMTVMSVDLVDTARLSTEVDPEVLGELLTRYQNCVARAVAAAGGRVVTSASDGVLACFGWPEAREDAAECAIRAGFLVTAEVGRLKGPQSYQPRARVGIATGLVIVAGAANAVSLAGEAPNLAVGLQRLASPGTMAISDVTHRQVGRQFEYEALVDQAVSEFSRPVQAWRPVRESSHLSRFQAARAVKTSFIGRVHELSLLADRWRTASEGNGRTVVILAEAGMGKSRMVDALRHQIGDTASITWQCSPYHQIKPFYPVVEQVTHAAGIADADAPAEKLCKLSSLLATAGMPLDGNLALFAQLLSIEPDTGFLPSVLSPNQTRAATIAALIEWLRCIASAKPLLLVLEDAHWIDASTMELLTRLVGALVDVPLLTVITARPEFVSPWSGRAEVSTIGLDRLSNRDCEALVREVAGPAALQGRMVEQILSRCDGNPLFVEELSAAVMEGKTAAANTVPDSLQSSLMGRLDRLGDAKQTAQICSVLGRRFARPLLTHVAAATPDQLDSHLALLVEHDVIRPISFAGKAHYEFKHALVRDAAYESLLLSQRHQLHEACGRCLEEFFPDVARNEPELLANHFSLAGAPEKASAYAEQAGDRATAACAFHEAIASYEEALRQNDLRPDGADHSRRTLDLLLKLGPAVGVIRGAQDPLLRDIYWRAEALSRTADDKGALFKAVWGLWFHANIAREFGDARAFSQQLVHIGEQAGDDGLALEALHCRWSSALFRGDYSLCAADARRGVELYDRYRHHKLGLAFGGHDPGVCAFGCIGQSLVFAGDIEKGFALVEDAIALGKSLDHPGSLAHGLQMGMIASTVTCAPDPLRHYAENMLELTRKFRLPPQEAMASYHLAWVEAEVGDRAKGLDQMEALYNRVTAIGPIVMLYKVMYVDQMLKAGRAEDALCVVDKVVAELRYPDMGIMLSELLRLRGESLAVLGRKDEARMELLHAGTMAERDGAALLRLRAANSLYREVGAESKPGLELALAALSGDWAGPDVLLGRALLAD